MPSGSRSFKEVFMEIIEELRWKTEDALERAYFLQRKLDDAEHSIGILICQVRSQEETLAEMRPALAQFLAEREEREKREKAQ